MAHRQQYSAASRSHARTNNGDGDHIDLTNSDDTDDNPVQNHSSDETANINQNLDTAQYYENAQPASLPVPNQVDGQAVRDNHANDSSTLNADAIGEAENLYLPQEPTTADENLTQNQLSANVETAANDRNDDNDDIVQKMRKDLKAEAERSDDDSSSGDEVPLNQNELSGNQNGAKDKDDDNNDIIQKMREDLRGEADRNDDDSSSGDEEPLTDRQQNENPPSNEKDNFSDNSSDDDSDVELEEKYQQLVSGSPQKKKKEEKEGEVEKRIPVAVDL